MENQHSNPQGGAKRLTYKQEAFVRAYLGPALGNATKAAELAGYSGRRGTLAEVGYENLRKPEIASAIAARLDELAMTRHEVLARLTDMARSDMGDFLDEGEKWGRPVVDLEKAIRDKKTHLIKKIAFTKGKLEFELYDAQAALVQLGKYHKLFVDRTEVTGKDGEPVVVKVLRGVSMEDL